MTRQSHVNSPTMSCLDCGYILDGLTSLRCPECGRPFDPSDHDSFRRILFDPECLHVTPLLTEAHVLKVVLEANGIPAAVEDGAAGLVERARGAVWVNREDVDAAKALITQQNKHINPGEGWVCPSCNEHVEGQFEACWSCQHPRPDDSEDQQPCKE